MVERSTDELIASGLAVIDQALALSKRVRLFSKLLPLFSGGYDSLCACYVASQHKKFAGTVYHIDTGIGSKATRAYVELVCKELGWRLSVHKSKENYETLIRESGFPGPPMHRIAYIRLKERCVDQICRQGKEYKLLVTGARMDESVRRMGHLTPIRDEGKRLWLSPCHDWTTNDQRRFMDEFGFPRNPVKDSILGMSGECFCGAFARPSEREMLRQVCPDVDAEITRLEGVAKECNIEDRNATWGYRKGRKVVEVLGTGPLCQTCDRKAGAAGIVVTDGTCTEGS